MYLPPIQPAPLGEEASGGYSYGAALFRGDVAALPGVLALLRGIRFSGWIAPQRDGWTVVLGDPGDGVVARDRRGVIEVGALIADELGMPVLAARVRGDRQLSIVGWRGPEEIGRYCSDPANEPGADDDVLAEPFGSEHAEAIAHLWGRADAAEELAELLEEDLDPDSVFESERLGSVLRLLGMPRWIVGAGELPRDIPTGPRARELVRLRAGRTGLAGRLANVFRRRWRRRQTPPAVIADPPTGSTTGFEPWML
ncbi:hypothetical protein [Microbacterium ulmi]|uniref:Uncharacterized protein n=1 Tax=Microbacterium ulmi TaxID=179095 RepID=A0A7Y2Q0W8_9MICO|nr:hypothetical protein [Microbacterium ulmi]NII68623.1 hypothetical protein [Microbacterium ulmi]NNH04793.1 hypothetical protein [Microbacterium ulmi]